MDDMTAIDTGTEDLRAEIDSGARPDCRAVRDGL